MLKRWFPCLLSVMLGLLLLPSAALAQNRTAGWGKGRSAANNRYNGNYRTRGWRNLNRAGARHGGWGYRNNGYGDPTYRQGGYSGYRDWDRDGDRDYWRYRHHDWRDRCVDPDHDGDCDFIRHPHRRWHDDDDDGYYGGWRDRGWEHHDNGRHLGWYKHARHEEDEDDD